MLSNEYTAKTKKKNTHCLEGRQWPATAGEASGLTSPI